MDTHDPNFLIGLVIGIGTGMAIQFFLRAVRDVRGSKAQLAGARRTLRWRAVPKLIAFGFVAFTAAVAAIRLWLGTAP